MGVCGRKKETYGLLEREISVDRGEIAILKVPISGYF